MSSKKKKDNRKKTDNRKKKNNKKTTDNRKKTDNRMFKTLAAANVKKNAKNYLIYFVTLMFSVVLLYAFNSIGSQFAMLNLADRGSYLSFSSGMIAGVSVLISMIMAFLVVYANRFLMKRRKKELGIYITLGMKQKDLSAMLFRETVIIGFFSLAAGLVLGIFLSQGLSFITIRFLQIQGATYHFVISLSAIIKCTIFYLLIFICMNFFNNRALKKSSLIDLLHAEKKNENVPEGRISKQIIGIAVAGFCFAAAYMLSATGEFNIKYISVAVFFVFVGTFLFFRSVSAIFLRLAHRRKGFYYKGLNMFGIHQVSSKIKSTNVTLAVISLLLFLSFTTMAAGLGISGSIIAGLDKMTSADVVLTNYREWEEGKEYQSLTIEERLLEAGFSLDEAASDSAEVNLYNQSEITPSDFMQDDTPGKNKLDASDLGLDDTCSLMSVSDYNKLRKQQGLEPVNLGDDQFIINYNFIDLDDLYEHFAKTEDQSIVFEGKSLTLAKDGIQQVPYRNGNVLSDIGTLIVPDYLAEGKVLDSRILNVNLKSAQGEEAFEDAYQKLDAMGVRSTYKRDIETEITSTNMTFSYIAVYLGIIFLVSACAVLALQQIADAVDNKRRYDTLRDLGAKESDIKKTLLMQVCVYFGVPLGVGLLHSGAGIYLMYHSMENVTTLQVFQNILFAALVLLGVYGTYFLITYVSTRNALSK